MKFSHYIKTTSKHSSGHKLYTRAALVVIGVTTFLLAACTDTPVPPVAPIVIEAPSIQLPAPSRQEPSPVPPATPTATASQTQSPTSETQYCDQFDNIDISVVYLDWMRDNPLEFYFNIPGGVPGLEKDVPGESNDWEYSAIIGTYTTSNCKVIRDYAGRLYCNITLPAEYAYTAREMSLSVNNCDRPVYNDPAITVPEFVN